MLLNIKQIECIINVSEILQLAEITVLLVEHVSCRPDGMVECWNVGLNKEVTHSIASLSRGILPIHPVKFPGGNHI